MKEEEKRLNDTRGFTLIELLLLLAISTITMMPVYKMLVSGAKIQKASEETYEATLQARSLLESVRAQIEIDLGCENKKNRGLENGDIAPWLLPGPDNIIDPSLFNFLNNNSSLVSQDEIESFRHKFKTESFLYEVHIWHLEKEKPKSVPDVSFTAYDRLATPSPMVPYFDASNTSDLIMIEMTQAVEDYYDHKDAFLWTTRTATDDESFKGGGVISYNPTNVVTNGINIKASGVQTLTPNLNIEEITDYQKLINKVNIDYKYYPAQRDNLADFHDTYEFIITDVDGSALKESDYIYLSVDLTNFPYIEDDNRILRIENKTQGNVVIPVYNEKNLEIQVFPIQHEIKGNMIVEHRHKHELSKNFIIGIIVRDTFNSAFGEANKVLSKIVDIYSYDYNK